MVKASSVNYSEVETIMNYSKSALADLGLLFAAVLYGSTFFVMKDLLTAVHPVTLLAYRFIVAGVLLLALAATRKQFSHHIRNLNQWKYALAMGAVLWGLMIPQVVGLQFTTASNSGFITGLFVVIVPLLSWVVFRQQVGTMKWLAISLAMLGLWLLTGGISGLNLGDALTLVTAGLYAVYIIVADRALQQASSNALLLAGQHLLVAAILTWLTAAVVQAPLDVPTFSNVLQLGYLAVIATGVSTVVQMWAQRYTTPVKAGLLLGTEPLFAALLAWTLGGEEFVLIAAVGGLLIVLAIMVAELPAVTNNQ